MGRKHTLIELFARRMREVRKAKGMNQDELGWECGLHRTYVGAIERGEGNPGLHNVERIAKALKVPAWELLK